jgi:hypothetical protein
METPYEHRAKYGFHNLFFSKPSHRACRMYWALIGLFSVLTIMYILLY